MYICLQIIMPVPQIAPSMCSDTCQTTSHDGSQNVTVKVEEGLEAEVGEGPETISFPEIKAESEVRCVSVFSLLHISQLNSTVVLYLDDYNRKVNEFISSNNFTTVNADITKTLQKELRNTINECQNMIQNSEKWELVNLNPTAPTMRGLIEVHKDGTPHQTSCKLEECTRIQTSPNTSEKTDLIDPNPLRVQHKEHSPADGRPNRNPTRTVHEICLFRYKQHVLKYPHRGTDDHPR